MLNGLTINNMVEGGPAYKSKQLEKGDIILSVDGQDVTLESCPDALIGNDVPGSMVTMTVQTGGCSDKVRGLARLSDALCDNLTHCRGLTWSASHVCRERSKA